MDIRLQLSMRCSKTVTMQLPFHLEVFLLTAWAKVFAGHGPVLLIVPWCQLIFIYGRCCIDGLTGNADLVVVVH